jgi:hypothetical protein
MRTVDDVGNTADMYIQAAGGHFEQCSGTFA